MTCNTISNYLELLKSQSEKTHSEENLQHSENCIPSMLKLTNKTSTK